MISPSICRIISRIIILLLFIFSIHSCQPADSKNEELVVINIADNLNNYRDFYLSDFADSIEYIPLEQPDGLAIEAHGVYRLKDYLLIRQTDKGYFAFSLVGKFIKQVGSIGRGPEEYGYANPPVLIPESNEFLAQLWDIKQYRKYSVEEGFIRSISTDQESHKSFAFTNGNIISNQSFRLVSNQFSPLCLLDSTGQVIKELRVDNLIGQANGWVSVMGFLPYSDNEAILFGYDYDSLYLIDNLGDERIFGYLDLGKYYMPQSMRLENNSREMTQSGLIRFVYMINLGPYYYLRIQKGEERISGAYDKRNQEVLMIRKLDTIGYGFINDMDGGPSINPDWSSEDLSGYGYSVIEAADLLMNYEEGYYDKTFKDAVYIPTNSSKKSL